MFVNLLVSMAVALTCFGQTPDIELPETPGLYAVIDTSMGRMVALLYVKNFVDLARGAKATRDRKGNMVRRPYFNGLTFHRVIKGFMIQTGRGLRNSHHPRRIQQKGHFR
jgi:hypothetical protein